MKDKRIFFVVVASLIFIGIVALSILAYTLATVPGPPMPAPTGTATSSKAPPHIIRGTVISTSNQPARSAIITNQ